MRCSLHDIPLNDTQTDKLTDSTATRPKSRCCGARARHNSLLSCATCGNSPETSPETSTVQDVDYKKLGSSHSPDPLQLRSPPKIVVVPESIRKLSDYKFPTH